MSTAVADRIWALLPAVHRLRDAEHGGVLRELVDVLASQVEVLEEQLDQMYDDQFIETCAPWVVPYLGDLVGFRLLHSGVPGAAAPRAEVANTIAYRRRKGPAAVLEQLARDVTGWPARAVEFFERVASTQYMNHPRPHAQATLDLRATEALGWVGPMDSAFDDHAHTADVRRVVAQRPADRGRHGIANVGIFLWRTQAQRLVRTPLSAEGGDGLRWRFDVLGADTPLYRAPRTETAITHLAEPTDVPLPMSRRWLADHLEQTWDDGLGLVLEEQAGTADPVPVPLARVRVCDLSDVGAGWAHAPTGDTVAVDPVLGRVFLGTASVAGTRLLATWHHGVATPIGAGTPTRERIPRPGPAVTVAVGDDLQAALDSVAGGGTVEIVDSDRYAPVTIATTAPAPGLPDVEVHLVARDGARPVLAAGGPVRLDVAPRTTVVMDGLVLAGGPLVLEEVGDAQLRTVVLRSCTLVPGHDRSGDGAPVHPGRASLIVLDPFAEVVLERCVLGPVVAVEGSRVTVRDSAVDASSAAAVAIAGRAAAGGPRTVTTVADQEVGDGTEPAGSVDLEATTVVGGIHATVLDASNSLLVARLAPGDPRPAAVRARRRQVGCVRFTLVPPGSRTGTRFHCQPDPQDPGHVQRDARARFTSLRFGDPGYLQLSSRTPDTVRAGADDEGEMGAAHLLHAPQRERNLRLRLDEYLRFGLEAGIFTAT